MHNVITQVMRERRPLFVKWKLFLWRILKPTYPSSRTCFWECWGINKNFKLFFLLLAYASVVHSLPNERNPENRSTVLSLILFGLTELLESSHLNWPKFYTKKQSYEHMNKEPNDVVCLCWTQWISIRNRLTVRRDETPARWYQGVNVLQMSHSR